MKSIIVGTDFSKGSYVALEIAVDIANKMETGIKLLWVKKEKKLIASEHMDVATRLAEEKLEQLCEQYRNALAPGKLTWQIREGKVASVLAEEAKAADAPMIVIGTNGASGFEKYWMGSTAVRIVQESPCPTLTVREGFDFHKRLEHILCPLRVNANSRQKVPPAAQMAKIFGSTVHILGLIDTAQDASSLKTYMKQSEDYLRNEGVPFTSVGRRYENYSDTVLKYAEGVKADLIVINTEQDQIIKQLFLGTNAQQMVHKSQIPILCIHPEDIINVSR